jgi:hypothetical protein
LPRVQRLELHVESASTHQFAAQVGAAKGRSGVKRLQHLAEQVLLGIRIAGSRIGRGGSLSSVALSRSGGAFKRSSSRMTR